MPEVQSSGSDQQHKHENSSGKRIRHRKKQLYANILKQMEFYFSDANLTKDRFLGDLVKKDPHVPLETFLKFNKIRLMTQDVNDIAKAMKHSTLLELSEDRTKVRRILPLESYDADARTVYVESIPVTASRDWLERVFSDYGTVAYISLPKFKNSQKIKGYAFIEFAEAEHAQKCLSTFTKLGCKLPTFMPPEELSSIKMFSVDNEFDVQHKPDKEEYEPPRKKKKSKERRPQRVLGLDLRLGHDSDSDKKLDTPTDDESKSITTPIEDLSAPMIESSQEDFTHDEGDQDAPRKKKSRKRTKEKKGGLGKNEAPKGALWGLQILAKSEWKALRNKYLNLQRTYMKEMKRSLQGGRPPYGDFPEPAPAAPGGPAAAAEAEAECTPGVFVRQALPEPCLDVRLLKRTIKANVHAVHVEVKEGQCEAIIRFDSAAAARAAASACCTAPRRRRPPRTSASTTTSPFDRLNRLFQRCRVFSSTVSFEEGPKGDEIKQNFVRNIF